MGVPLATVVLICDTFDNNFGFKNDFAKYLKESCWYCSEKYFPKYAFAWKFFIKFVRLILAAVSINGLMTNHKVWLIDISWSMIIPVVCWSSHMFC